MKIEIKQTVDVPVSPYCKNCLRQARDSSGQKFCTVYNRNIWADKDGHFLKCMECYLDLYNHLSGKTR